MSAKAELTPDTGFCARCKKEDVSTAELKRNGQICEDCYLKIHQMELPLDEYTLKPDELTKEQFAEKAGVSIRNIEIWKASGKLPSEKVRRRINNTVRKTTIFKLSDVEKFLAGENNKVNFPTFENKVENSMNNHFQSLQLSNKNENQIAGISQLFVNENIGLTDRMIKAQLDKAEADAKRAIYEGNLTFPLDEAAELFNLSIVHLRADANTFKGKNQKLMITKKNLDLYLENL
jgi:DNA-binding transcriptional MerR regulator